MPSHSPARNMRIVHSALRRDLARARWVLSAPADPRRLAALGRHLAWVVDFLEHHHHGEDDHIWPELLRRDPGLADLLARMDADHERIHEPMERLRAAGLALAAGTGSAAATLAAVDALTDAVGDHLRVEETEAMDAAGRLVSDREWDELSEKAWVAGVPPQGLAANGLWILDGQTAGDGRFFMAVVPLPVSIALRVVFGPGYALKKHRLWGGTPAATIGALPVGGDPRPVRRPFGFAPYGDTSLWVAAPPDEVYALVSDPARVGEWSHEAVGGRWEGGATHAAPGARFTGRSTVGRLGWSVPCVVDIADGRTFAFHTRGRGSSTQWRYDLLPADGGTLIRQQFRILELGRVREVLLRALIPAHRDRSDALRGDLVRLGEVAARHASDSASTHPAMASIATNHSTPSAATT